MKSVRRPRGLVQTLAFALALAFPLMLVALSAADARAGRGGSSGSRGSRTFSAPAATTTAPNAAQPFNRTMTQPGTATRAPAAAGGAARPGMGMLGGLAAGFLGAGLLGMLFGGGLFSGLGGLSSIIGLLLQVGLIVLVVRFAMSWWRRRNAAAFAGPADGPTAGAGAGPQASARSGLGGGLGSGLGAKLGGGLGLGAGSASASAPLDIKPDDYEAFERLLGDVQAAWSAEDVAKLHTLATPEMVSYFTQDLAANTERGVVNKTTDVKLLQGDLAEAWREDVTDFASVAMRFSFVDKTFDRASGKVVEGSDTPTEATEIWTFARRPGQNWELSAIQQA